jgi:hypothetical protein
VEDMSGRFLQLAVGVKKTGQPRRFGGVD